MEVLVLLLIWFSAGKISHNYQYSFWLSYNVHMLLLESEECPVADHLLARCSKVNDRYLGFVPQPHLLFLFLGSSLCLGEALNVRALVGDDVTLSVDTKTSSDIGENVVEWSRTDLNPDIVHRHENRRTIYEHQNPAYRGRTMLSAEDLDRGIISLKLSNVRLADEGNYTCLFKSTENMYSVHLLVGKTAHGRLEQDPDHFIVGETDSTTNIVEVPP
jgi:hypothetical protein